MVLFISCVVYKKSVLSLHTDDHFPPPTKPEFRKTLQWRHCLPSAAATRITGRFIRIRGNYPPPDFAGCFLRHIERYLHLTWSTCSSTIDVYIQSPYASNEQSYMNLCKTLGTVTLHATTACTDNASTVNSSPCTRLGSWLAKNQEWLTTLSYFLDNE